MISWDGGRLDPLQRAWADERLTAPRLVRDMSWNLVESIVLHVRDGERDLVIKAGDASNHHILRELAAHPRFVAPLTDIGRAARLLDADPALHVMLLEYLPGVLLEGTEAESRTDTYAQAGALLRALHAQESRQDAGYEARATAKALSWLSKPHRIDPDVAQRARRALESAPGTTVSVVPTHGDWQPRNWLLDDGIVRVIDFGRFAFRPASTDFTRLAAAQWRGRPELEHAFLDGYGDDPRDPALWRIDGLRQAVGTACWAYQVGDERFERQGHRMLAEALDAR